MIKWTRTADLTYEAEWEGATYLLLKEPGRADDKGRPGRMAWFLHSYPVPGGVLEPALAYLGRRLDRAKVLTLFVLEGWTWYYGTVSAPGGEIWRHTTGTTRPLTDLLAGAHRTQ